MLHLCFRVVETLWQVAAAASNQQTHHFNHLQLQTIITRQMTTYHQSKAQCNILKEQSETKWTTVERMK